ncbi:hypothetical protein FDECE_15735 [Fusarium decemcellulare]|nr:hypothetical protein FDECE_15735 [Fusarium decemcellulare]
MNVGGGSTAACFIGNHGHGPELEIEPHILSLVKARLPIPEEVVLYLAEKIFPTCNAISLFWDDLIIELPERDFNEYESDLEFLPSIVQGLPYDLYYYNGSLLGDEVRGRAISMERMLTSTDDQSGETSMVTAGILVDKNGERRLTCSFHNWEKLAKKHPANVDNGKDLNAEEDEKHAELFRVTHRDKPGTNVGYISQRIGETDTALARLHPNIVFENKFMDIEAQPKSLLRNEGVQQGDISLVDNSVGVTEEFLCMGFRKTISRRSKNTVHESPAHDIAWPLDEELPRPNVIFLLQDLIVFSSAKTSVGIYDAALIRTGRGGLRREERPDEMLGHGEVAVMSRGCSAEQYFFAGSVHHLVDFFQSNRLGRKYNGAKLSRTLSFRPEIESDSLPCTSTLLRLDNSPVIPRAPSKAAQPPHVGCGALERYRLRQVNLDPTPRRLTAKSIAVRLAEEMDVELGAEVGSRVRYDDKASSATRLEYMKDGMRDAPLRATGRDSGLEKQEGWNPRAGMETLQTAPISQASARQRAGQASRTKPVKTPPGMAMEDLSSHVSYLMGMGFAQVAKFDFVTSPSPESFLRALQDLHDIYLINADGVITFAGRTATQIPTDPMWMNAFKEAQKLGCLSEMIAFAALLSTQNSIFRRPEQQRYATNAAHRRFKHPSADHMTHLNALYAYSLTKIQGKGPMDRWCYQAFLNRRILEEVLELRGQLLAATGIAEQVANEMDVKPGQEVGSRACVIIDEAHERNVNTDLLIALLKTAAVKRPDLKVVIMSATINSEKYFSKASGVRGVTAFEIEGRNYPVQVLHLEKCTFDYVGTATHLIRHIHKNKGPGDILLFVPSIAVIEAICSMLRGDLQTPKTIPLCSALSWKEQRQAFASSLQRKCVGLDFLQGCNFNVNAAMAVVAARTLINPGEK